MIRRIGAREAETRHLSKGLILAAFGLACFAWNYSSFSRSGIPGPSVGGLDPSWSLALNWASLLGIPWLRNSLVFTYGPLYWTEALVPWLHGQAVAVLLQVGLNLFYTAGFTYCFSVFLGRFDQGRQRLIAAAAALLLLLQYHDALQIPLFVAFILLPVWFESTAGPGARTLARRSLRYGIAALLLGVIPLIKVSYLFESGLIILITMAFLAWRRRVADAVVFGLFFVGSLLVLWVLATGQSPGTLPSFLASRLQLALGYSEAMQVSFTSQQGIHIFILAVVYMGALAGGLIYLLWTRRFALAAAWSLPMVSLYLDFKESFVRADGHTFWFLILIQISAAYYMYLILAQAPGEAQSGESDSHRSGRVRPILAVLLILFALAGAIVQGPQILQRPFFKPLVGLLDPAPYAISSVKTSIQNFYHLDPRFLSRLDPQATTDIIPWDIALLYGYSLQWNPRPVLQSYAAYTPALDRLDADYLGQPDAPRQLIYSFAGIDGRYPLFDAPAAFRAMLTGYEYVTQTTDGSFALFRRRSKPLAPDWTLTDQGTYSLEEEVPVPRIDGGYVFMTVDIQPTILGRMLGILYKVSPIVVEIKTRNLDARQYRFIRATGVDGLFVSKYVGTLNDLEAILAQDYKPDILSVRFHGSAWLYHRQFQVRFYKMPIDSQ